MKQAVFISIFLAVCALANAQSTAHKSRPDGENQVFVSFPEAPALYAPDVAAIVKETIRRYGQSEWRAGVLTNELHGHLGIYAIIGVKMGVFACEHFGIDRDELTVVSYAGSHPPVSCLNDGLQVSTGATLGHGLISVVTDSVRPEAAFSFEGKTIRLRLKKDYAQHIIRDVAEAIRQCDNLTDAYWRYIRVLAIRYWQEWDRREIFEIVGD